MSKPRERDREAERIGRVLHAIRTEQDLTQKEVAEKLNVGENAYGAWEIGRSRFTVAQLPDIARALGVDAPYLSRRLGLCGDNTDLHALLREYVGPDVGVALARFVAKYPNMDASSVLFASRALKMLDQIV